MLRIRPELTAFAAAGLVCVMIGATGVTLATMGAASALIPVVVGILAAFVAYGRLELLQQAREHTRAVLGNMLIEGTLSESLEIDLLGVR